MNIAKDKERKTHGMESFPCNYYKHDLRQGKLEVVTHWHPEYEILHLIDGTYIAEIDGDHQVFTKGYLFINRDELHSITSIDEANEEAVVFRMEMMTLWEQSEMQLKVVQPLVKGELQFPRFISEEDSEFNTIDKYYKNIANCHTIKTRSDEACGKIAIDIGSQLEIMGNLFAILGVLKSNNLFKKGNDNGHNKQVANMKAAFSFIEQNYDKSISVGNIANTVSMNEQYFSRIFKKVIGMPPMEYVNAYRIKNAKSLLLNTNKTVTEIALECGFHNMGNFIRTFKKITMLTPKEYRKKS